MSDPSTEIHPYPETERRIFRLELPGRSPLYYDPAPVARRLDAAEHDHRSYNDLVASLRRHAEAIGHGTPADDPSLLRAIATDKADLAKLGFVAFEAPPLDPQTGEGWTEADAIEAVHAYVRWEAELRGKPDGSPNTSTPSAGQSPASPSPIRPTTG